MVTYSSRPCLRAPDICVHNVVSRHSTFVYNDGRVYNGQYVDSRVSLACITLAHLPISPLTLCSWWSLLYFSLCHCRHGYIAEKWKGYYDLAQ